MASGTWAWGCVLVSGPIQLVLVAVMHETHGSWGWCSVSGGPPNSVQLVVMTSGTWHAGSPSASPSDPSKWFSAVMSISAHGNGAAFCHQGIRELV
ncbi:hypothetical protein AVEN_87619-1 [Araneus ventricosus]|uniref:Uncharacterized protein n=1 Tax=Araneus ventricosus TaxID=182803 RepID=A0A4Y2NSN3_ARAVE|nr:hypothetical protein AVEN_87619-1 [Araneus ventricosus]